MDISTYLGPGFSEPSPDRWGHFCLPDNSRLYLCYNLQIWCKRSKKSCSINGCHGDM